MPFTGDFNPVDFNAADFFVLTPEATTGPPFPPQAPSDIGEFEIGVSQIGEIPAFSLWNTVLSQYANSPTLTTLIQNWFNYIDQTQDLIAFFDQIMSLDTAQGYGLDLWGRILGVQRVLPVGTAEFFGFASQVPTVQGFNQAPFFAGAQITNNFQLSDSAFRILLFAKALANITNCTIPALNEILVTLFPGRGNAFVTETTQGTNFIFNSNSFNISANWFSTNSTITPNAGTSPDNTNDAWLWQRSSSALADVQQTVSKPAAVIPYTFSIYAKSTGGTQYCALFLDDDANNNNWVQATFNLFTGTVSNGPVTSGNFSNASASIQNAGNGWWRCSLSVPSNNVAAVRVAFAGNFNNALLLNPDSSNTTSMLFFGAQLEETLSPNFYVPTTNIVPVTGYSGAQMSMTYTFNFVLSPVEQSIVASSGVLPKPAGVALTIVQQ